MYVGIQLLFLPERLYHRNTTKHYISLQDKTCNNGKLKGIGMGTLYKICLGVKIEEYHVHKFKLYFIETPLPNKYTKYPAKDELKI